MGKGRDKRRRNKQKREKVKGQQLINGWKLIGAELCGVKDEGEYQEWFGIDDTDGEGDLR
jgi:hypothetical protein